MDELDFDWCSENRGGAAQEIKRLNARIAELEEAIERLRDGRDVVVPYDDDHARYMKALAEARLQQTGG